MNVSSLASIVLGGVSMFPPNALLVDQRQEAVRSPIIEILGGSQTPPLSNGSTNADASFLIYDEKFIPVLGANPSLTLLLEDKRPIFHEAGVFISDRLYITSNRIEVAQSPQMPNSSIEKDVLIHRVDLKRCTTIEHNGSVESATVHELSHKSIPLANGGVNYGDGLLICAQGTRKQPGGILSVSGAQLNKSETDFEASPLVINYRGRAFNSPNDVVVHSDGSIWFTDPIYGFEQGFKPHPVLPGQVYRFDPGTGDVRVVADGFGRPNGIAFSPAFDTVYITDTDYIHGDGTTDASRASTIYQYDVLSPEMSLTNRRVFAYIEKGYPDGIKCDTKGNVYAGCGDGVHVWDSSGTLIGKILLPSGSGGVSNLVFGDTPRGMSDADSGKRNGELFLLNEKRLWYVRLGLGVRGALLGCAGQRC